MLPEKFRYVFKLNHSTIRLKEALLILKDVKGVGMVFLDDSDVIRHKLVKDVIDAYKNIENLE